MQIQKISFTNREIDVISCILNSRRIKKIASILLISPKTVETHIQNILKKINGSCQENIIDFIEKSPQFKAVKDHYINLLVMTVFEQQLQQLFNVIHKQKLSCTLFISEVQLKDQVVQQIIKHLKLSGLEVIIKGGFSVESQSHCLNIYFIDEKNTGLLLKSDSLNLQGNNIFIIQDITFLCLDIKCSILNFSDKEKYFQNFFSLLTKVVTGISLKEAIANFNDVSKSIRESQGNSIAATLLDNQGSRDHDTDQPDSKPDTNEDSERYLTTWQQSIHITENTNTVEFTDNTASKYTEQTIGIININNSDSRIQQRVQQVLNKKIVRICTSLICLITLSYMITTKLTFRNVAELKGDSSILPADFVLLLKNNNFSADNATPQQIHKNHSLIGQIEKWFGNTTHTEKLISYFARKDILSEELVDYLSNLHALANYYIYHEHDGKRARTILEHAKNLIENYVTSRSKVKLTFAALSKENTYTELSIVKDLPEIYTQILYALGRSFLYQGNMGDSTQYFELSEYLGKRLGLFEGYLSVRSGLMIIAQREIERELEKKDYINVEERIIKTIASYKTLQQDNSSYILNFKPSSVNSKTIIPAKDIYNTIECQERICRNYARLVLITPDSDNRAKYLEETVNHIAGNNGLIAMLSQLGTLPNKKIASIYNSLGHILLGFYEKSIDFSHLLNLVIKDLKLEAKDELEAMEQIFKAAVDYSRNTDYTKADSYDGLIKVYQKQISLNKLTAQKQKILQNEISVLKSKRDSINKQLNRESKIYN
jgi:DNA-binding CsgD family transcriptional regulator